jgi:predicted aldo/keto reductase-like oxidoreductase
MLSALMYAEGYGDWTRGRAEFERAVAGREHVRCQGCEGCTVSCPCGVGVPGELSRAHSLLT